MSAQNAQTRERILEVATELFAKQGPDAVGVREIATKANVNLSAINYHFKNKSNLVVEVLDFAFDSATLRIEELYENRAENCSFEDFAVEVFDFYTSIGDELRIIWRMMLGMNTPPCLNPHSSRPIGPPGSEVYYRMLKEQIPGCKEEDYLWAIRALHSEIMHKSLLLGGGWKNHHPDLNVEMARPGVKRLAKVLLNEIKISH